VNPFVVFRDYGDSCVGLFPEIPGSKRCRECLAFSEEKGFHTEDYDQVMFRSRASKTNSYRTLIHGLKKLGYIVNMVQKASNIMEEKRKSACEIFDYKKEVNQLLVPNR
jgi:hypothetical protein